jgi:hypothetical protein
MTPTRSREEIGRILLFNCVFFGTLAWLGSAAIVGRSHGWWYDRGQIVLALAGIICFWMAWWWDQRGQVRQAINSAVPGVAALSVWVTSVHPVL